LEAKTHTYTNMTRSQSPHRQRPMACHGPGPGAVVGTMSYLYCVLLVYIIASVTVSGVSVSVSESMSSRFPGSLFNQGANSNTMHPVGAQSSNGGGGGGGAMTADVQQAIMSAQGNTGAHTPMVEIPVMEPSFIRGQMNPGAAGSIPPELLAGNEMGNKPHYEEAGIAVVPSLLETQSISLTSNNIADDTTDTQSQPQPQPQPQSQHFRFAKAQSGAVAQAQMNPNVPPPIHRQNGVVIVPVMDPEKVQGSFNGLNASPDEPTAMDASGNVGNRPFFAQAAFEVDASFLQQQQQRTAVSASMSHKIKSRGINKSAATLSPNAALAKAAMGIDCPLGTHPATPGSSQQGKGCVNDKPKPMSVLPMPRNNPETYNQVAQGYNPILPPVLMPGMSANSANPALAVTPSFVETHTYQSHTCINCEFD
jgi:hypothetical protein